MEYNTLQLNWQRVLFWVCFFWGEGGEGVNLLII